MRKYLLIIPALFLAACGQDSVLEPMIEQGNAVCANNNGLSSIEGSVIFQHSWMAEAHCNNSATFKMRQAYEDKQ